MLFKNFYEKYLGFLHCVGSQPNSILSQKLFLFLYLINTGICMLFEKIMNEKERNIVNYLRSLSI